MNCLYSLRIETYRFPYIVYIDLCKYIFFPIDSITDILSLKFHSIWYGRPVVQYANQNQFIHSMQMSFISFASSRIIYFSRTLKYIYSRLQFTSAALNRVSSSPRTSFPKVQFPMMELDECDDAFFKAYLSVEHTANLTMRLPQ